MSFRPLTLLAAALLIGTAAHAADYQAGKLRITQSYARATAPGQPAGAAYLTIENQGNAADTLIAAASPVAKSVEIHTMAMEGNLMKMREVGKLELQPGATTAMKPGEGYHLMLMGLKQPLKAGESFPITLTFEKAGKVDISVPVEGKGATAATGDAGMHHRR